MSDLLEIARDYQYDLYLRALERNVIAYASTGSGKTLIAQLLINKYLAESSKYILFLVNTIALGQQQASYIKANVPDDSLVGLFYGQVNSEVWDWDVFESEIQSKRVLILTAALCLDLMRHSYLQFDDVGLIIFDECHHARKKHPYQVIMQEFYFRSKFPPKILGLTASPAHFASTDKINTLEIERRLLELQCSLHSVVVSPDSSSSITIHANKPIESFEFYHLNDDEIALEELITSHVQKVAALLRKFQYTSNPIVVNELDRKILNTCSSIYRELGLAALVAYLKETLNSKNSVSYLQSALKPSTISIQKSDYVLTFLKGLLETITASFQTQISTNENVIEELCMAQNAENENGNPSINNAPLVEKDAVEKDRRFRFSNFTVPDEIASKMSSSSRPEIDLEPLLEDYISNMKKDSYKFQNHPALGSKVLKLLQILKNQSVSSTIIFVERRIVAHILADIINEFSTLKAVSFVGTLANSSTFYDSVLNKSNKASLDSFRKKDAQVLVATSVAEEGLDIQSCDLVVRFVLPKTITAYIQSRGRARHINSKYVFMIDELNPTQFQFMKQLKENEELILEKSRSDLEVLELGENEEELYYETEENAILSLNSAIGLLNRFISTLPGDSYYTPTNLFNYIEESGMYQCTLILPINSPLSGTLTSDWEPSKKLSKKKVCYEACVQLHKMGYLNQRLMPSKEEREAKALLEETMLEIDEEEVIMDKVAHNESMGKEQLEKVIKASEDYSDAIAASNYIDLMDEDKTNRSYFRQIKIEKKIGRGIEKPEEPSIRSYAQRLHPFEFKSDFEMEEEQVEYKVFSFQPSNPKAMKLLVLFESDFDLDKIAINDYEFKYIETSRFPSDIRSKALQFTYRMFEAIHKPSPPVLHPLRYLILPHPERIQDDFVVYQDTLNRLCVISDESLKIPMNVPFPEEYRKFFDFETYKDFFQARHKYAPIEDDEVAFYCLATPSLTHQELSEPNFEVNVESKTKTRKFLEHFRIKSKLKPYDLPLSAFYATHEFFRFLHSMQDRYLVYQLQRKFNLENVDPDMLRQALTLPSCSSINYERLEIIGDAVLKWIVSLYLFLKYDKDEGFLTKIRYRLVSNKRLRKVAASKRLFDYFIDKPFLPNSYCPPCYKIGQIEGNSDAMNYQIKYYNDKCLADVLESILGAVYMSTNDMNQCIQFLQKMEVIKEMKWEQIAVYHDNPLNQSVVPYTCKLEFLKKNVLNAYGSESMNYPVVYLEALSHVSDISQNFRCFQRLEYLGDALLDLFVTKYIYENNPDCSPGQLSPARASIVNSFVLGRISYRIGLPKLLIHFSSTLPALFADYYQRNTNLFADMDKYEADELWKKLMVDTVHPPKIFSDILESVMAAIFIDNHLDYDLFETFVLSLLKPVLVKFGYPSKFLGKMPKTILYEAVSNSGCQQLFEWQIVIDENRRSVNRKAVFRPSEQVTFSEPPDYILEAVEKLAASHLTFLSILAVHDTILGYGKASNPHEAITSAYIESIENLEILTCTCAKSNTQ